MARPHSSKPGVFQADVFYGGKRKRKDFDTLKAAEAWEVAVRSADELGLPMPGTDGNIVGPTIKEFADAHLSFLWGDSNWGKRASQVFQSLEVDLGSDFRISDMTYDTLVKLVSIYQKRGNSNSTINRKMAVISKLLKHAHKLGSLGEVPAIPRFKEFQGRIRYFTKQEEAEILSRMELLGLLDAKHITRFLLYTGARWGEGYSAQWRDVDENKGTVSFWKTKADLPRTIPITPPVQEAIDWFMSSGPKRSNLFPLGYETYSGYWDRVRHDLGYADDPQFVIHTLRHTCASRLVQAGVDLRRVQTWMGHKSISMTLRYAHLAPTDLEIAATALVA